METEPRGNELIVRYKKTYHIPNEKNVSEQMILEHWELEKRLTKRLLNSTKENRWATFDECYSKLYGELYWLNTLINTENEFDSSEISKNWVKLIGDPPKRVYEIGSGKGELISSLAKEGYNCKATEITMERGEKHVMKDPNLSWGISDGIHLENFEKTNYYDIVISNQVIEHIHPDDLDEHLKGVFSILNKGGKYIFTTPHKFIGPSDVSRVFNCDEPIGMHLREYTYKELGDALFKSGFSNIKAVAMLSPNFYKKFSLPYISPKKSSLYFNYLCFVEEFIYFLKNGKTTRISQKLLLFFLLAPTIILIAKKK